MQHHRMQPFIVQYVSLFFFHVRHWISPPLPYLPFCCSRYWSLPMQPGSCLHPSSCSGFFLHFASLDSPRITWEKELLCLLLCSIIAPATPTTGFICWRRMTSDTSASQAGLPLSPAQALFLVAEGAERVFNEIQTLGVSSHKLLKTSLPLTSVTNVRISKKNLKLYRGMLLCCVNEEW